MEEDGEETKSGRRGWRRGAADSRLAARSRRRTTRQTRDTVTSPALEARTYVVACAWTGGWVEKGSTHGGPVDATRGAERACSPRLDWTGLVHTAWNARLRLSLGIVDRAPSKEAQLPPRRPWLSTHV